MDNKLILASASKARADLLLGAGLDVTCLPADLDEDVIKAEGLPVVETAVKLAEAKARAVAQEKSGAYVIGADQMMECEGQRFDKPVSRARARDHLKILRGKTHHLISAVAIVKDAQTLWTHHQTATLEMRAFSDDFLDAYLDEIGDDVLTTVGGYRLESLGVQLFQCIEGDYFTILGLPLLAVLDFLRGEKRIAT